MATQRYERCSECPFVFRRGPLEVRRLNEARPEIVFWQPPAKIPGSVPFCFTVASWTEDGGCGLRFCGDRPFRDEIDFTDFMALAKAGQKWLTAHRSQKVTEEESHSCLSPEM